MIPDLWNSDDPDVKKGGILTFIVTVEFDDGKRRTRTAEFANEHWLKWHDDYDGEGIDDNGGALWSGWMEIIETTCGDETYRKLTQKVAGWMPMPAPRRKPCDEVTNPTSTLFIASTEYKNHVQDFPTVKGREWSVGQKFIMAMAAQDGFTEGARWMFGRWPTMISGATTANKLAYIESTTKFHVTGFILRSTETNHAALIEQGAVRWLADRECNALMHPHHPSTPPSP